MVCENNLFLCAYPVNTFDIFIPSFAFVIKIIFTVKITSSALWQFTVLALVTPALNGVIFIDMALK